MDYLQQVYTKIFGNGDEVVAASTPRKLIAFGNVLLDRTAQLEDTSILDRFQLAPNTKGELDAGVIAKITAEASERINCAVNPGGAALNSVRILKTLGTEALFFGAIGEDKCGEELKDILKERGVEASLQKISDAPTGQCICLVHNESTTLYANIGASGKFSKDYLKQIENDNTKCFLRPPARKQIIYIEGFFVPQREEVCEYIVKNYISERRRLAINLSATYIVQQNFDEIRKLVQAAYFVFGNNKEFEALMELMNCKTLDAMAKELLKDDAVKIIIITKGGEGVQVISNFIDENEKAGEISFQNYNVPRVEKIVDTTGAGDAFVAGFLDAWLEKRPLSECVRVALDVAAKVVTQIGCNLP